MFKEKKVTLHITAAVNYYKKSSLFFYNYTDNSSDVEIKRELKS